MLTQTHYEHISSSIWRQIHCYFIHCIASHRIASLNFTVHIYPTAFSFLLSIPLFALFNVFISNLLVIVLLVVRPIFVSLLQTKYTSMGEEWATFERKRKTSLFFLKAQTQTHIHHTYSYTHISTNHTYINRKRRQLDESLKLTSYGENAEKILFISKRQKLNSKN